MQHWGHKGVRILYCRIRVQQGHVGATSLQPLDWPSQRVRDTINIESFDIDIKGLGTFEYQVTNLQNMTASHQHPQILVHFT